MQVPIQLRCSKWIRSILTRLEPFSRGWRSIAVLARKIRCSTFSSPRFWFIHPRVLIHPNTNDAYKDHTELMSWMGKPWPLYTDGLKVRGWRKTLNIPRRMYLVNPLNRVTFYRPLWVYFWAKNEKMMLQSGDIRVEVASTSRLEFRPFGSSRWLFFYRRSWSVKPLHHSHLNLDIMSSQILDNALGAVGHTPLIRLDKVARQ